MESNLEDNITQSQSEKNPQKSKGNSRRKKILCKKHETGRKGQNEVNSSENTTLQQQYEKGEISFKELCQAIINQKDNPISRKENVERFEDDIEDEDNDINNNTTHGNNVNNNANVRNVHNTNVNVNANTNVNVNDNDDAGINALQHYRRAYGMEIQDDEINKQYSNYITNMLLQLQQSSETTE